MKSQRSLWTTLFFLFLVVAFTTSASAQDLKVLTKQMQDRKPTIDALKTQGVVGEGLDGYLHFRQAFKDGERVVNAENADRRAVNAIIAKNEGTTVEVVTQAVVKKLYSVAAPGHWLQKNDGSWYQKK